MKKFLALLLAGAFTLSAFAEEVSSAPMAMKPATSAAKHNKKKHHHAKKHHKAAASKNEASSPMAQ